MPPVPYATMTQAKDQQFRFDTRRKLALAAKQNGVKPTARRWGCSRNTVRFWKRRYEEEGLEGLKERSHAPQSCPHKTPPQVEELVRKCRETSGFGARRLKEQFDLPCSHGAIERILRQHGLTRKPRKRHQKKNDLREAKRALAAFERVQMDVKYLTDLAHYVPQMELRGLPRFQYTLRDTRTGLLYLTFADQLSKTHASAALAYFLNHLTRCGVDTSSVTIQTDNGTEFGGRVLRPRNLPHHRRLPGQSMDLPRLLPPRPQELLPAVEDPPPETLRGRPRTPPQSCLAPARPSRYPTAQTDRPTAANRQRPPHRRSPRIP